MNILLIAGLWLDETVWADTVAALAARGHRGIPVTLPGTGDDSTTTTLDEQLDAVLAAVDSTERPFVVGHSAASTLAWLAGDRRVDTVAGVGLVGGMPTAPGEQYAAFFPRVDGAMAFPGWEPFAGADSDDLSDDQKDALARATHPVAAGVAEAVVDYSDARRRDLPVVMICPEYSPADAQEWIDQGAIPELSEATHLHLIDLDTGHWPMASNPEALADSIVEAVGLVQGDARPVAG